MVDVMTIAGAITAARGLCDTVKNAMDAKEYAKVIEATIELNDKIIDLQTATLALQERFSVIQTTCANLEREKAELHEQLADKKSYRLHEIVKGRFVYRFEPDGESSAPPHYVCQPCYDKGSKSILHVTGRDNPYYECFLNKSHSFNLYPTSTRVILGRF